MLLFDRLAYTRKHLYPIAGVATGRVDEVAVPITSRRTDLGRKRLIDIEHQRLQVSDLRGSKFRGIFCQRLIICFSAALEVIYRIFERCELQVWYPVEHGGQTAGFGRIGGQLICPIAQQGRLCLRFVAFFVGQLLYLVEVFRNRIGEWARALNRNIRVTEPQHLATGRLS